jgi:cytolysin-activating lysine-acyltransferase
MNAQTPATPAATPDDLTRLATLAKEQSKRVMEKIPLLGPVAWLMMQQSATRHTLLSELEWRVMPALVLNQSKLYMRDSAPIAYVSWALLSEAVVERYKTAPHQLTASDWKSGDQVWLIDLFTPFGGAQDVLKDVREVLFKGQVVHQLMPTAAPSIASKTLIWPAA